MIQSLPEHANIPHWINVQNIHIWTHLSLLPACISQTCIHVFLAKDALHETAGMQPSSLLMFDESLQLHKLSRLFSMSVAI